mgnify:CR=1 FL=1
MAWANKQLREEGEKSSALAVAEDRLAQNVDIESHAVALALLQVRSEWRLLGRQDDAGGGRAHLPLDNPHDRLRHHGRKRGDEANTIGVLQTEPAHGRLGRGAAQRPGSTGRFADAHDLVRERHGDVNRVGILEPVPGQDTHNAFPGDRAAALDLRPAMHDQGLRRILRRRGRVHVPRVPVYGVRHVVEKYLERSTGATLKADRWRGCWTSVPAFVRIR